MKKERGFWGVAMYYPKTTANIGSLMRTAHILGCDFYAVIGSRFERQRSDVFSACKHIPVFQYKDFDDFYSHMPHDCLLIGVEMSENSIPLEDWSHPQRCIYLFGAEDNGIPKSVLERCHQKVILKGERSMNVAVAGSIVIYDRFKP